MAKTSGNAQWTVMVFMSADPVAGEVSLTQAAKDDIREMAAVGSGDSLNIYVQVHGIAPTPIRGRIDEGTTWQELAPVLAPERDTKGGKALFHFVEYSLRDARHNAVDDEHYSMLVMWGHAYDFGIGRVPTASGTPDALDFAELRNVLSEFQQAMRGALQVPIPPRLDIIAFDACDVATVELACELAPYAKYLVGSQVGVPIPGWPYDRILERLRLPYERLMAPAEFAWWAVRRYCESYASTRTVSLSALDLQDAERLFNRTHLLAETIIAGIRHDTGFARLLADHFLQSVTAADKPYIDVADLCLNLARGSGEPMVTAAARALGDFLVSPSFGVVGHSHTGDGRPFVVAHGRNAVDTAKLNGISLYAPHVAPSHDFAAVRSRYNSFRLASTTRWSQLVHALAEAY